MCEGFLLPVLPLSETTSLLSWTLHQSTFPFKGVHSEGARCVLRMFRKREKCVRIRAAVHQITALLHCFWALDGDHTALDGCVRNYISPLLRVTAAPDSHSVVHVEDQNGRSRARKHRAASIIDGWDGPNLLRSCAATVQSRRCTNQVAAFCGSYCLCDPRAVLLCCCGSAPRMPTPQHDRPPLRQLAWVPLASATAASGSMRNSTPGGAPLHNGPHKYH